MKIRDKDLTEYKECLSALCYYTVIANTIAYRMNMGVDTPATFVKDTLENAEKFQKLFLAARKRIGLSEEMKFLTDDYRYFGFSIRYGAFYGDPAAVDGICKRHILGFDGSEITEEKAFKYEIATLAYQYAGVAEDVLKGKEPEITVEKKVGKDNLWKKIVNFFRRKK